MNIKALYHGAVDLYHSFEQSLNGWPDLALTLVLILAGIVCILIGLGAPRWLKLLVLAWVLFP